MSTIRERSPLCGGCLSEKAQTGPCFLCSWDDTQHLEVSRHLKRHSVLLGRYYIGRILTELGTRVTYLAWDYRRKRVIALTEHLPVRNGQSLEDQLTYVALSDDILSHARALAKIEDHPNLCPVLDVIEASRTIYVAMPVIDGVSLKQYLAQHDGQIATRTAIAVVLHVLDALRELHNHGIVHQEIGPSHILITTQRTIQLLCLIRFELHDEDYAIWNLPNWGYAPEELYRTRGKRGPWTDVYSVGATLYECITGVRPPFAGDRLAEDDLRPLAELCPGLPTGINVATMKALAIRAPDRFQTAMDFQTALLQGNGP